MIPPHLADFWNTFAQSTSGVDEARFYEAFYFGDNEELANELGALVLAGPKRGTASADWLFDSGEKRRPAPGDLSIVTNWAGQPLCIIETQSIEIVPFDQVTAEFAASEAEGDGSLEFWREGHRSYFSRECASAGREFSEQMLIVCERFTVVYQS